MQNLNFDYKYGFSMPDISVFKTEKGISAQTVYQISKIKNEPDWMTEIRLKAFEIFRQKKMPDWGADLSRINFDEIFCAFSCAHYPYSCHIPLL